MTTRGHDITVISSRLFMARRQSHTVAGVNGLTELTVNWLPATFPAGAETAGYQVFMSTSPNPVPDPDDTDSV